MINTIYSVKALDRKDDEIRLFTDRDICIEYIVKNWSDDKDFWEYCMNDFVDWCIDHDYKIEMFLIGDLIGDYVRYMLNKDIHYFDEYELFETNVFNKFGQGTFCKVQ